jgi:hypothetical protein
MSAATRRRAFWLAAAAVAAAAVVIAVLTRPDRSPSPGDRPPAPTVNPRHHHTTPPNPPALHTHPRNTESGRAARNNARMVARTFIVAYLAYEAHPTEARARECAHLTVPDSPARALLRTPPRRAPGSTPGRVALLELHGPYRGWLKASAIVRYGSRRLLIELVLTRAQRGGAYRVRELSL